MFCTSLRKRPEWAPAIPSLLASQDPRWKERDLQTHDIAIRLPLPETSHEVHLRMLLLSDVDLKTTDVCLSRIERLYNLDGDRRVCIVFLLNEKGSQNSTDGMTAYMKLQTKYSAANEARLIAIGLEIQVLPLFYATALHTTLWAFLRQLLMARGPMPVVDAVRNILPHCAVGQTLPEHARNVLSDVCDNLRGLAEAATTSDGRDAIRQYLSDPGSQLAENVIRFWQRDYKAS